jgi:hypothetical protein
MINVRLAIELSDYGYRLSDCYFFLLSTVVLCYRTMGISNIGLENSRNYRTIVLSTVEEGNTEHLSAFNIILKILRNVFSGIFFHRRANE